MAGSSAYRKKRYRRRNRRIIIFLLYVLFVVLTVMALAAAVTIFFKIREVRIEGESRYTPQQIIYASQIETGKNMFSFNKFSAIEGIFDECPYLDEITIRRRLPDVVTIKIKECRAVAVIRDRELGGSYVMDINGKLLEKLSYGEIPEGVCVITGVSLEKAEVGKYSSFLEKEKQKPLFLLLNTAEKSDILKNIGEIDITENYNITLQYDGRFTVKLGTSEDLEKKLRYMQVLVEEKLGSGVRGTIDVSDTQTARFLAE